MASNNILMILELYLLFFTTFSKTQQVFLVQKSIKLECKEALTSRTQPGGLLWNAWIICKHVGEKSPTELSLTQEVQPPHLTNITGLADQIKSAEAELQIKATYSPGSGHNALTSRRRPMAVGPHRRDSAVGRMNHRGGASGETFFRGRQEEVLSRSTEAEVDLSSQQTQADGLAS